MALSPRFELRQTQSLVMTPQLLQAIKLLQLSNLDVTAFVEAELERNPLLERLDSAAGEASEGERRLGESSDEDHRQSEAEQAGADERPADIEISERATSEKLDTDLSNEFPDDTARPRDETPPALPIESWSSPASRQSVGTGSYNLEAFVAAEATLADHLNEQFGLLTSDPARRLIGQAVISEIDEAGYFRGDAAALCERLGIPEAVLNEVVDAVQTLEPSGVGARDLTECLAIQLRERDRLDPAMQALIGHLDLVARRDLSRLASLCGVDMDDLADMLGELKALNPKPGNAFGGGPVQLMIPDVTVRQANDGGWLIELNQETLPRVLVDQAYFVSVSAGRRSDKDRAYLSDCMQSANWLVKSLDQRAKTILKVTSEIVRQQDAFLVHGVQHLRPLNLKTVADAIDMHESTVSRVTSNKFVATPRGIFELKYFFTASIPASGAGEPHSAEAVRDRIRRLIDSEPTDAVLSDDAIVRVLRGSGIEIARRTVAKYREGMRISSSVQRRREKQVAI